MPDPNLGALVISQVGNLTVLLTLEFDLFSKARIQEIRQNLPPLPQETRSRLLDKFPELKAKEQSLDVLLNVDNGREVAFDGESSGGAVNYFEQLCLGENDKGQIETRRNPGVVLKWYIFVISF
jgi:aspartyl-tRNA(Asn)/glutamyl-tRNA(Gln) amidotransferase subunit B